MAKTTQKEFQFFIDECNRWAKILGLEEWRIEYKLGGNSDNSTASYITSWQARGCIVRLTADCLSGKATDKKERAYEIQKVAFHEMVELSLYDLRSQALFTFRYSIVDEATHKIVNTLEKVLFPKYI